MPDIDLRGLVKDVLNDPAARSKPMLPTSAIVVGDAFGETGNRTGVYGHSERSIAICGKSPVYAGYFEGNVQVDGELDVDGDVHVVKNLTVDGDLKLHGQSVGQLVDLVRELVQRIAQLEASGVTRGGVPTVAPASRPQIAITGLGSKDGQAFFFVSGNGFNPHAHLLLKVFNTTKHANLNIIGEPIMRLEDVGKSAIVADKSGLLPATKQFRVTCNVGDKLNISMTDWSDDPNDMTGVLWSNTVTVTVP